MMRAARSLLALAATSFLLTTPVPAQAGGGGGGCLEPVTASAGDVVEIRKFCFTPTVLEVPEGTTVTFVNRDGFEHNVVGANESWGDWEGRGKGESLSHRFRDIGVYPFTCTYHPGMVGAVLVGDGIAAPSVAAPAARIAGELAGGVEHRQETKPADTPWRPVALASMTVALAAILVAVRRRTRLG